MKSWRMLCCPGAESTVLNNGTLSNLLVFARLRKEERTKVTRLWFSGSSTIGNDFGVSLSDTRFFSGDLKKYQKCQISRHGFILLKRHVQESMHT